MFLDYVTFIDGGLNRVEMKGPKTVRKVRRNLTVQQFNISIHGRTRPDYNLSHTHFLPVLTPLIFKSDFGNFWGTYFALAVISHNGQKTIVKC